MHNITTLKVNHKIAFQSHPSHTNKENKSIFQINILFSYFKISDWSVPGQNAKRNLSQITRKGENPYMMSGHHF